MLEDHQPIPGWLDDPAGSGQNKYRDHRLKRDFGFLEFLVAVIAIMWVLSRILN